MDMSVSNVETTDAVASDAETISLLTIALTCLASACPPTSDTRPELEFLMACKRDISPGALGDMFQQYLEQPLKEDLPLINVCHHYNIGPLELLSARLCMAVEQDPLVGRSIAFLQHPLNSMRPSLGLLDKAFHCLFDSAEGLWLSAAILSGNAVHNELLVVHNSDQPMPDQLISVPLAVATALSGIRPRLTGVEDISVKSAHCVAESARQEAQVHAKSLLSSSNAALVIRSAFDEEKQQVAACVAEAMNREPLYISDAEQLPAGIGLYCEIMQLVPVYRIQLEPAQRKSFNGLKGYSGPIIVLLGLDGWLDHRNHSQVEWLLPTPKPQERARLWAENLQQEDFAEALGARYLHSAGRIAQLSRLVLRRGAASPQPLSLEDVTRAASEAEVAELDSLAQRVSSRVSDDGLVLDARLSEQMKTLYLRCLAREQLREGLGVSIQQRYHCGVKALLVGPSGTGKTLSAAWLAGRLGLPLYRVDIASIVSKYIGETEKNLANLLEKAESSDVVLLFDEADSLFGKRTDVKDSSDRFANSQTNYLLQRIENYQGIVLLTSNSRSRIDSAFLRRIDHVIEFGKPSAEERRKLWRVHLGDQHSLPLKDINRIAAKSELAGGHIRNAVLTAAVFARHENRAIQYSDVLLGIASEYRKLGKQLPAGLID